MLEWSNIPDGFIAEQRGRRQPVFKSSSCECRQTVCIGLAPKCSRNLARLVGVIPDDCGAEQRGRRRPLLASSSCEGRPNTQTVCISLAPTSSHHFCSTGRRSLAASLQSKEDGGSRCQQAALASAGQTRKQFASASHRRAAASLLDWSTIPDGFKEEGGSLGQQAAFVSASQNGKQFASALHRRAAASLLGCLK